MVPLHQFHYYQDELTDQGLSHELGAIVLAVPLGGQHVIFSSKESTDVKNIPEKDSNGKLAESSSHTATPWLLLVTAPGPITGLTASAHALDKIRIDYITAMVRIPIPYAAGFPSAPATGREFLRGGGSESDVLAKSPSRS